MSLLKNYSDIPFFLDRNLKKNFKVFGQVLYIYFDPTFRRHVSVVDVGLKQKSNVFIDEIPGFSKAGFDNDFRFLFLKRKDDFLLKSSHFLNLKNERISAKNHLYASEKGIYFYYLRSFSLKSLNSYSFFSSLHFKCLFHFNVKSFILLKAIQTKRLYSFYKFYTSVYLSFFRNLSRLRYKTYKTSQLFFGLKFWITSSLYIYKSLFYLSHVRTYSELKYFVSWIRNFKMYTLVSTLNLFYGINNNLTASVIERPVSANKFSTHNSEKRLIKFFALLNRYSILRIKSKRAKRAINDPYSRKSNIRFYLNELNENASLLTLPKLSFGKVNKLAFSFNSFPAYTTIHSDFLQAYRKTAKMPVIRKLRTKNYFAILSSGKRYAFVNKPSFFNLVILRGFLRKYFFRNWLKFIFYYERLNYLLILNTETHLVKVRELEHFFGSVYFPLIFNFRNFFFYLLRLFRFIKIFTEKNFYNNSRFVSKASKPASSFLGILFKFLLLYNRRNLNKIPKKLLAGFAIANLASSAAISRISAKNKMSLFTYILMGIFTDFINKVEYLHFALADSYFYNTALRKRLVLNSLTGINLAVLLGSQSHLNSDETLKTYASYEWIPLFNIIRSRKYTSRQALKYKKRPNFSKRRRFRALARRRNAFLKTQGALYTHQVFRTYPFRFSYLNDYRWSTAVKRVHFSPVMARYGAYLQRINALSRRYRERLRIFDFKVFKNKLGRTFELPRYLVSKNLYFYRFLTRSFSNKNKIRRALLGLKRYKYLNIWNKIQNPFVRTQPPKRNYQKYSYNRFAKSADRHHALNYRYSKTSKNNYRKNLKYPYNRFTKSSPRGYRYDNRFKYKLSPKY